MLGEHDIDKIIYDEEGNIIDIIEPDSLDEVPDYPDSYYESEGAKYINTTSSTESKILDVKKEYDTAKEELINILQKALTEGKISSEDRYTIRGLVDTTSTTYSELNEMLKGEKEKTIQEEIQDIKDNMIPATPEGILNILTENGSKCWLYTDGNKNVLIDGKSIPELTVLVNKLNLIAIGDGEDSEIQLTPEFINMIVQQTGSNESIKEVLTKYYLSTSTTELIGGNWLDTLPSTSEQEGKYLWYKIVTIYKDPTKEPKETDPVCISARDGKDGTSINMLGTLPSVSDLPSSGNPGDCYTVNGELYIWSANTNTWENCGRIKGEQGTPGANSYLHIKYSDDGVTFTANDGETPGIYIGVLSNNTQADSTNFNDYTWSRIRGDQGLQGIQGPKGDQGIKGEKGDPGQTTYFHIKYSANANGNPMTETPSEYIGTYVDYTQADSTDYTKYTWAKFKGDQGVQGPKGDQGIPGTNGTDGKTYYLHIKYSNDGGKTFTSNNGEDAGDYIGVYTDTTQVDSTSVSKYTWSKIKGEQGPQGVPGTNGKTTYTWIKYANDANGSGLSNDPTGKLYIGFAYNKTTATESNTASDYTWSLIKGDKGDTGAQGPKGTDGKTTYTWIKYSDNSDGTGLYDTPKSSTKYIGIATNKTTAAESSNKADYVWSQFKGDKGDKGDQGLQGIQGEKGDQGIQGPQGPAGTNGKTTYFHIKYSSVASPTSSSQMTETPSAYIGTYVDYTSTDSTDPSKYTWSRFQGLQGAKGEQGIPGNNGSDGKTYYLHIKYSNDGGSTFTSNNGETPGAYIGVYTDTTQADSTSVSKYTWSKIKGEQGQQGNPGDDGRGVEDVKIEYAKNQSTTTAPTSGWSTTMPTYQEGYYLWYRTGVKYTDSSSYVYGNPVCDQSWKVAQETYTQYKQLADKFTWLVKSGDSQSTMQLTDKLFELVSQNITLTAEHINLNGYVSNDGANWSIDNEGNIKAENLKIEGDVGADTLSVNYIDNPRYPATLAGSVDLYVNSSSGNDDYTLDDILQSYDEAEEKSDDTLKRKFKTLQGALDASPAYLNNKNLCITLETDTTEDVYIRGFTSGAVRIYANGKTIYGYVHGYADSATVNMYGGTADDPTGSRGIIHPNTGFSLGTRCVSAGFEACQYVALYKMKVFGADNKPSSVSSNYKVAVASSAGTGSVYCSDVEITNCAIGFRANNMGCIHGAKTSGVASRYAFEAITGGQISLADASQAGGTTANTSKNSGGQVWYNSPKFATGSTSSDPITAPETPTTKTMTIKSTYGDTYRSTVYNNWKKDGTCRQGDYGYGDCSGLWFFGTAFSELKDYNISKVEITITRNSGGSSSAVGLVVRTHNYSARPSGAPTLSSSSYGTLSLATGATGTLTITNSTVLNGIKNGTIKGFGIRTTYDAAHYAVCSGSATVKITYNE